MTKNFWKTAGRDKAAFSARVMTMAVTASLLPSELTHLEVYAKAVSEMDIPPSFDAVFYRSRYPDLAHLSDEQAGSHYELHGKSEGRMSAALAQRDSLAECARQAATKLEIGPFCNPILTGEGVCYLDMLDAAQLRSRANSIGLDPAKIPARIDYVGGIDQVTDRFDAVLSCHCIEHQPDLVTHLNGVAAILNPGGRYFLIIPDKRYCFDHYIAESTLAGVIDAHREGRQVHVLRSVIEHMALTTHNDPGRHWRGDHGPRFSEDLGARIQAALDRFDASRGAYVDVHAWYFTPTTFRVVIQTLFEMGLTRVRPAAVYGTPFDRHEFCAILEVGR